MVSHGVTLQAFVLVIACSLVLQHFVVFAASRPLKICDSGIRARNNKNKASRKQEPIKSLIVEKIEDHNKKMASREHKDFQGFVVNRYKKLEDAYRPTAPGHSPGIGHPP
ncbi:hypothetical protein POM88_002639 [Heracleum sosnowskyi]|uniref:Uncharacterized protein n=1 Tax=Heracleum sosnowskyi TaxID=360622 RepID=A0AAD8JGH1_9APIA|nr:hypothetical protein POM88_002639 [Heracleum sosnowskyi]